MASAGTGVAASKYLITSSEQVKPGALSASDLSKKARRSLRGQRGPAGARGATGLTGPGGAPGQTGPRGPSDAWVIDQTGQANGVTLPAGSYVIGGNVYFGSAVSPECTVYHTTGGGGASGRISFGPATSAQYTLPMDDAITISSESTVYVTCSGGGASAIIPQVVITEVETLHL